MKANMSLRLKVLMLGFSTLVFTPYVFAEEAKAAGAQVPLDPAFEQVLMAREFEAAASHLDHDIALYQQTPITLATMLYRVSAAMMIDSDTYEDRILAQLMHAETVLSPLLIAENKRDKSNDLATETQATTLSAQANALMSGIVGLRIAISPWKGLYLGRKSSSYLEKALNMAPDDRLVVWMSAVRYHRTPASFGGDIEKARAQYARLAFAVGAETSDVDWLTKEALLSYCSLSPKQADVEGCSNAAAR